VRWGAICKSSPDCGRYGRTFALEGLEHRFGAVAALRVAQWRVEQGERWLLSGASGSGKSTLLNILAGLLRPAAGRVKVAGQDLAQLEESALDRWRGRNIGYVPQRLHLIESLDVLDNLLLAQFLAGATVDRPVAIELLASLGIDRVASRKPQALSQGQAQRVAIARAVINRPALLLADEPTAALDDANARAAAALLSERADAVGATLVVASHDGRIGSAFFEALQARAGMNLFRIAYAYARESPLTTVLNLVLLVLGVATVTVLLLLTTALDERLKRDAAGIDLVVGAKGSPLQLVRAGVVHVDVPPGTIPLAEIDRLRANPLVASVVPIAMGDSYFGYHIVGTEPAALELYGARFKQGRRWSASMEAVLGAEVAQRSGLVVGAGFAGSHGLAAGGEVHADEPYRVVGVLEPAGNVVDRLILTGIDSVWKVHRHEAQEQGESAAGEHTPEVTMGLVHYATPLAAATLPRQINSETQLQSASPAYESARLLTVFGVGTDVIRAFAAFLMLAAGLGMFIALYQTMEQRQ
jgi:putative ABC transport system permease protein